MQEGSCLITIRLLPTSRTGAADKDGLKGFRGAGRRVGAELLQRPGRGDDDDGSSSSIASLRMPVSSGQLSSMHAL